MGDCRHEVTLAPDVVASAYAPHERTPRRLTCDQKHPHPGRAHTAEGWAWWHLEIWLVETDDDVRIPRLTR